MRARAAAGLCALAAIAAGRSSDGAPPTPPAARPLYYEHQIERSDLEGRSAEELRLMRNTIFARAGRTFKDPALRAHFETQPWYRPQPGAETEKLGPVDEMNLARIRKWEPRAAARAELRRMVPGWDKPEPVPRRADCEADASGRLADRKQEKRLVALAAKLSWSGVGDYGNIMWDQVNMKQVRVELACLPDVDGDGAPEATVTIGRGYHEYNDKLGLVFLVSGKGPDWRAVAPLGISGTFPSVEGGVHTSVRLVKLADGKPALAIQVTHDACCDECCLDHEFITLATLKRGTLTMGKSFDTSDPCECDPGD